jgi:hypothetical protein
MLRAWWEFNCVYATEELLNFVYYIINYLLTYDSYGPLPPTGPSNAFATMKFIMHRAIRNSGQ